MRRFRLTCVFAVEQACEACRPGWYSVGGTGAFCAKCLAGRFGLSPSGSERWGLDCDLLLTVVLMLFLLKLRRGLPEWKVRARGINLP